MTEAKDYQTPIFPTWCPGCGNFGIWGAIKKALSEIDFKPHQTVGVFGIGCSGNGADFLKIYGFHTLHGRTLPVATGIKLANHKLNVFAMAGDGDAYGIGLSHLIHTARRNLNITLVAHNNQTYGLTTGQTSPTSDKGFSTKSTPDGAIELPVNPIALALSSGATFVSRGFAGDIKHLTALIEAAFLHKGFALVDVLQPCVTFNKKNTYTWFRQRIIKLEEINHNQEDLNQAFNQAKLDEDQIPIGIFYRQNNLPTYEDQVAEISKIPLVEQLIDNVDISKLLSDFS
jgi:2-oxoglutarate ferredoxin oxidoreductase subunit beta